MEGVEGLERMLKVEVSGIEPRWVRQAEEGQAFRMSEQTR
jgi:hypothetical protein